MTMHMKVFHENIPGGGEDAGIAGEHYAVVFDGLGGTGAITCHDAEGNARTEAKLASGAAARAVKAAIEANWDSWNEQLGTGDPARAEAVTEQIRQMLPLIIRLHLQQNALRWTHDGGTRYMPTTMAGWITFPAPQGKLLAVMLWAGDSRCYVIDAQGMRQTSVDDAAVRPGEDVMTELMNHDSPRMTNHLCLNKDFSIHCRTLLIDGPALLFACTDGLYNSIASPMHLEYYMRLSLSGRADMSEAAQGLQAFIRDQLIILDDSATVCALAHAPETGAMEELCDALLPRADALEEEYLNDYPVLPEPPQEDVELLLRRLAGDLAKVKTFQTALQRHIADHAWKDALPVIPGMSPMGADALEAIRDRLCQQRCEKADEAARLQRIAEGAEQALRERIADLRIPVWQDGPAGTDGFSELWRNAPDATEHKVDVIFNTLWQLRNNLFLTDGYNMLHYCAPTARDLIAVDPYLHDLIQLLNAAPGAGQLRMVRTCSAEAKTACTALDAQAQSALFDALVSGSRLSPEIAPELRLTLSELDELLQLSRGVCHARQRHQQAADALSADAAALTEAEQAAINANCAVPFARQYVNSWYRQHQAPEEIRLSENMHAQCEERLQACWNAEAARQAYSAAYSAYREGVLALWERYRPGYCGWDEPAPASVCDEAVEPELPVPQEQPDKPAPKEIPSLIAELRVRNCASALPDESGFHS